MSRPYMQHGVGQLAEMFANGKAAPNILKQLELELQHRQVPRAIALLAEVQAVIYGSGSAGTVPVAAPTSEPGQPSLWEAVPVSAAAGPIAKRPRSIPPQTSAPAPSRQPLSTMPIEDAYKVLKTTAGATWESIEQARRLLVQQSNPSLLKGMTDEVRAQALADARRANAAYAMLLSARANRP